MKQTTAISAFVLCLHILAITVLASSPHAHEALHSDAGTPEHTCIIALFEKGTVDFTESPFYLVTPGLAVIATLSITRATFSWTPPRHWLHIGRAPPELTA